MATVTGIAWCHHTFNPWLGCTEVSDACLNCYAADWARRYRRRDPQGRDLWDPHAERTRTAAATRRQPVTWDRAARAAGVRRRVFCASLGDVFDNRAPAAWRTDFWRLIAATPALDWLLLTKRPQNIARMLPADWGSGWPNVWLGTTTENRAEAQRRIPCLMAIPAAIRFLSVEPLLEGIDLRPWLGRGRIDWIIVGGESGSGRRPMRPEWARAVRDQAHAASAAFFMKQVGRNREAWPGVRHPKGENPDEWPEDLRVQEFPPPRD